MLTTLAYRNIWRNRRRTLITAASILFAVFFATTMRSIQVGAWQRMVDSVVHFYFGYVQIQDPLYHDEQSIENSLLFSDSLRDVVAAQAGVRTLTPRLESFALAAYNDQSRGALLIGVDPVTENTLTNLSNRLIAGTYFERNGVLLSSGLAEYLGMTVGDTAVFLSQGYHGVNAAGKYLVDGIVDFPSPELNKRLSFLPLPEAQWFYGADGRVTSIVVDPDDPDDLDKVTTALRAALPADLVTVRDYKELIPGLLEAKAFDEAGGLIVIMILYAIIGFGIFGTVLMMLKEREYEFGILKAIGMKSRQLQWMLWLETIFLAIIGSIAGMALALPVVYYLQEHPIRFTGKMAEAYEKFGVEAVMPATVEPRIFINQALVVVFMITVMTLYPMIKLKALDAIKAMRG